jgi:hypothetical protein
MPLSVATATQTVVSSAFADVPSTTQLAELYVLVGVVVCMLQAKPGMEAKFK